MFKNIVASGCSFTSDGIGGCPPSLENPTGACSFIYDPDYPIAEPVTWAGMIAKSLNVKSFVNIAASSHGNFLIANNIVSLINKFKYQSNDTLVLFNLSDPARMDIMCKWHSTEKSQYCDWSQDILPFGYVDRKSQLVKTTLLNMGIDQVELFTSNAVLGMMSFLKQRNFNFYFTMMTDYQNNNYLAPVIQEFKDNLVMFEPGVGMYEYASAMNLLRQDNVHPTAKAHQLMAEQTLNIIHKHHA